jgi:hypothetical protein
MLTRRQFSIGSAAMASVGPLCRKQTALADTSHFSTPLPIPELIDAANKEMR